MRKKAIVLFFLIYSNLQASDKLNWMESRLFHFTSMVENESIILPFYNRVPISVQKKKYHFEFDFFIYGNSDLKEFYDDVTSDNDQTIVNRIEESFGKPIQSLVGLKVNYKNKNFSQTFKASGGEVFLLSSPVFPILEGTLLLNASSITSYNFKNIFSNFSLKTQLHLARRKVLRKSLSALEVLDNKNSYKLNQVSWYNIGELNIFSEYKFKYVNLEYSIRSIPLFGQKFSYWDSLLGFRTKNFAKKWSQSSFSLIEFYSSYSPLYSGLYDVKKTWRLGSGLGLSDHIEFDLFLSGNFYINGMLKLRLDNFEVSIFTMKDAYDDFYLQESRLIGMNSKFQF